MKAYVIKNKEGKYFFDYWVYEMCDELDVTCIYLQKEQAQKDIVNCELKDCEIVEMTIAEGDLERENAKLTQEIVNFRSQTRGFQKAIEKRDKEIEGLKKGISKVQKTSYRIKESKAQDIITIAKQTENERNLEEENRILKKAFDEMWTDLMNYILEYQRNSTNGYIIVCCKDILSKMWNTRHNRDLYIEQAKGE